MSGTPTYRSGRARVAAYECLMVWRDPAVWVTLAVLLAMTATGWSAARYWMASQERLTSTLLDEQAIRLRDMQERMDRERETQTKKGAPLTPVLFGSRHATSIGHYSGQRWMVQPMLPTAPLALGEVDLQPLGYLASVDRWQGQQQGQFSSPQWQRFVRFDVYFVVGYLLPLALIVLCAGALSTEREHRTLSLRLTQGSRPWATGLGRVALRGGLLTLLIAVSVPAMVWWGDGIVNGTIVRLLLWEGGLVAYVLFWLSIIAWVDSRGHSIAANLLICAGLWIVLLFIAPGLVSMAAGAAYPVQSRADFERARREAYQETWSHPNDAVLDAFYAAHPEIPPDRDAKGGLERYAIFQMRTLEMMRETLLPLEAALDETARRNRDLAHRLRFASPLLLLHDLSTTAAGTDMARVEDFWQQRDRFSKEWDAFYITRIYTREPIEDLGAAPAFVYREPPVAARAAALLTSFAGLLLPGLALGTLAIGGFKRFPV